jgi:cupin fold WbuC family metalloprotein
MAEFEQPQHVGDQQLRELLTHAAESTRRRSHLLLHANHQDPVQRLLIALETDSYIRPHMHSEQWEMLILLRGRLDVLIFDPEAEIVQRLAMNVAAPIVQIPRATWHTAVALVPGTLVLELKPGPYRPNEFAEWAPCEGEQSAAEFVSWAAAAGVSPRWSA